MDVMIGFIAGIIAGSEGNFQCYCVYIVCIIRGILARIITGFIAGIVAGIIKTIIEAILVVIILGKSGHFLSINPGKCE